MRISILERENLSGEALKGYDEQVAAHGRITNMKKTLLHDVPSFNILMEWYPLRDRVAAVVGNFATDVYCHAISSANNCLICSTFFRRILKDNGRDPDNLVLDETEQLLADYGRACVAQPVHVSDELFKRMKARFNEQEIVMLTAFAGQMIATNLINNALEVPLDEYLTPYSKKN